MPTQTLLKPFLKLCLIAALAAAPAVLAEEKCASCHKEQGSPRLHEPVQLLAKDVHGAAGIACTSCHGGDGQAETAAAAHGAKGFIGRAAGTSVVGAMCGQCHKAPAENYLRGPHQNTLNAARRPSCATCHGSHGVQRASIELIKEPLCSSCHAIEPARRIHKALADAEREVNSLDAQLASTGNAEAQKKVKAARSELRGLSHSLDLFEITRNAARALATVDEVRAKLVLPRGASKLGLVLRGLLIGLVALALVLSIAAGVRFGWLNKEKLPIIRKLGPTGLKWLAIGGGALTLIGAVGAWRVQRYIDHDPKFCLSCHTMNSAFDLWQKSGHKDIDCHTCHIPNLASNLHQVWVYTTKRPDSVVKHAEIDRAICEQCHASGNPTVKNKWQNVVETPGHRVHAGKQRVECVQCHAMTVHQFKPPRDMCVTCHQKTTLAAAGTMAEMHCMQCHPFLAQDSKRSLKPDRAACLDCHAKRTVNTETFPTKKAPMNWECGKCHKPHQQLKLNNQQCIDCHKSINEGLHKVKAHANDCQGCHKPHDWTSGATRCLTCHDKIDAQKHHPGNKSCVDCHGAWDEELAKK